jgi:hypothetical protein
LDTWLTAIDEVYRSAVDLLAVKVKMTCRTDSATLGASSLSARKKKGEAAPDFIWLLSSSRCPSDERCRWLQQCLSRA